MTYSRNNPSPRFRELLEQYGAMHRGGGVRRGTPAEQTFDGKSLPRQAPRIRKLIARTGAKTLLDYGSGKGAQYRPAGIMENGVVRRNSMQEYWGVHSIRCVFANVACYPAMKTLPNGEHAHCTIRPVEFWRELFEQAARARGDALLWEVWADTASNAARQELRIGNFEPAPEAPPQPSPGRLPSGAWSERASPPLP